MSILNCYNWKRPHQSWMTGFTLAAHAQATLELALIVTLNKPFWLSKLKPNNISRVVCEGPPSCKGSSTFNYLGWESNFLSTSKWWQKLSLAPDCYQYCGYMTPKASSNLCCGKCLSNSSESDRAISPRQQKRLKSIFKVQNRERPSKYNNTQVRGIQN